MAFLEKAGRREREGERRGRKRERWREREKVMRASLSCVKIETSRLGENSQNVDSILVSLNGARTTKLHTSTRQRRQTIPVRIRGTTATDLLRPVHKFLRLIRGSGINDIADVILIDAFDLHTRRRAQVGEMNDIIVAIII
jgi:hypothetical protein